MQKYKFTKSEIVVAIMETITGIMMIYGAMQAMQALGIWRPWM